MDWPKASEQTASGGRSMDSRRQPARGSADAWRLQLFSVVTTAVPSEDGFSTRITPRLGNNRQPIFFDDLDDGVYIHWLK
jgi:hypothetical protein